MSETEAPLVVATPGGLSISYRGRYLYSARDPERTPRRVAASCDKGPGRLHLVPSPLLWHGIPELLDSIGEASAILCVEAEPELAGLSRERMPERIRAELAKGERLAFIETASAAAVMAAAQGLGDFRFCALLPLSGGEALHAGLYNSMAQAIGSQLEAEWRNRAALMVLGRRWALNIFDNLASLPDIAPMPLPGYTKAAVVCGAGASLEDALPFIAENRDLLAVVACDTALGTLLAAGIEPELVVCLEGQAHNLADFTCLGRRGVPVLADLSSHPATFRAVVGPKALSFVRITRSPFLDRARAALAAAGIPFLDSPPLGSVGVEAYFVARSLGDGPILAAGLDFSFDAGKSHARGCPALLAEERRQNRLTRWPGQYASSFRDRTMRIEAERDGVGRAALSDPVLLSYAGILRERASFDASSPARRVYDLRGRGPDIGGERVSFPEAKEIVEDYATAMGARSGREKDAVRDTTDALRDAKDEPQACAARDAANRAASSIIGDELARLSELRAAMHGQKRISAPEFARLALESDYLWWSFPDQGRLRAHRGDCLPQDLMNRLVPEAEWWSLRLEALMSDLERRDT